MGATLLTTHIRANIHVQRGEGGAPLLNLRGEVVGVLISDLDRGNAAFALPIEAAQKVHKEIMQFGELRPGWLGLGVHTAAKAEAGSTAQVDAVIPGAPAEEAGVIKGDYLVAVGELPITSTDDVWNAAFFTTAENQVTVRVWRDGEFLDLTASPTDHPKKDLRSTEAAKTPGATCWPAKPDGPTGGLPATALKGEGDAAVLAGIAKAGAADAQRHLFLCIGPDCCDPQKGEAVWDYVKKRVREVGLKAMRTKAGCFRICSGGPWLVVYPDGIWYGQIDPERFERILAEHLLAGQPVQDWVVCHNRLGEAVSAVSASDVRSS